MTELETVIYDSADGIARVTLNRPTVHNALNLAMRNELWSLLDVIEADDDVRVVLLEGAGASFCSGADLNDFGTASSVAESRRGRHELDLWGRMSTFEKPMIASLHGYALGAGLEMSLMCDFRIAAADSLLGLPEVGLGYLPAAGGSQTLPRLIGTGRALEMILTGDPIPASGALDFGLVHRVVPLQELVPASLALAQRLASMPPLALQLTKRAVVQGLDLTLAHGLQLESMLGATLRAPGGG